MKIILLQKIVNLGNLGDVVEVKNGYARNFLIPSGLAHRATAENLKVFESKRAEYERNQHDVLSKAQYRQTQIDGKIFDIAAKAGVDGKLFGSISALDIATTLSAQGVEIKKSEINMPNGSLKTIGEFDVNIILHHDVKANIKINVISDSN
jgi:large subunit ribosomal protein L9